MSGPGFGVSEQDKFLAIMLANIFELESLPPHQQQTHHVSEISLSRLRRIGEVLEAIDKQLIIDHRPSRLSARGDPARPVRDRSRWRSWPRIDGIILASQLPGLF